MEQDKITVKMNYCINPIMAQHVHIGGEFSIKPGQTAEQAWEVALERIDAFYQSKFGSKPSPVVDVSEPKEDKIQSWITVIGMCTSITALERFKVRVDEEKNEELTLAYNNKLKQLQ